MLSTEEVKANLNKAKKALFKYYKDKTIIIISHRNNNKNLFDRSLNRLL